MHLEQLGLRVHKVERGLAFSTSRRQPELTDEANAGSIAGEINTTGRHQSIQLG